jgi:serine/threonine protein kinase
MSVTGRRLGHYRIVEKLRQGGTGKVFLAEDLSLDREVALELLPDVFTFGNAERMARFERKAKLEASLNHPKIPSQIPAAAVFYFQKEFFTLMNTDDRRRTLIRALLGSPA